MYSQLTSRVGAIALVLVLAFTYVARGEEPVSANRLDGRKLLLDDQDCTIEAPGDDWKWYWYDYEDEKGFFCRSSKTREALVFTVSAPVVGKAAVGVVDGLIEGMSNALKKQGLEARVDEKAPADVPIAGCSYRYAVTVLKKGKPVGHIYGYLGAKGRLFTLSTPPCAKEPSELRAMAATLRVLRDSAADRLAYKLGQLTGACLGPAIVGVGYAIYRRRKKAAGV